MDDFRSSDSPRRVDRHRDRERHRPAPYPKDDIAGSRPGGNKSPPFNRVFISNIPYEEKWQKIKDLFRDKVGEVTYVELVTDDRGNSKGFGIVEFKTKEMAVDAVEKMKDYEIGNRKLVVKEDFYGDFLRKAFRRDSANRPGGGGHGDGRYAMPPPMPMPSMPPPMPGRAPMNMPASMPQSFSQQQRSNVPTDSVEDKIQRITGGAPVGNTIFIANLDYSVSYSKLKEVFSLAGKVVKIDLQLDKDNKSRGMATVTYESSLQALEAISMFHKQLLYDRPMLVKMDRNASNQPEKNSLPSGLQGIGPSLKLSGLGSRESRAQNTPPPPRVDPNALAELEMLSARKKMLENSLGLNVGGMGGASSGPQQMISGNFSGIPGLLKPAPSAESLGFNLSLLNQSSPLSAAQNLGGMGLARATALALQGISSDNGSLRSPMYGYGNTQDSRTPSFGNQGFNYADRERLDQDIARVDNRIRDLDRSLKSAEQRMSSNGGNNGSCSVFVSNLPFSLPWQNLRERFARVGKVMFANIKMEDGRSKGYGRVRYETPEEAMNAIRHFNGTDIDGRKIEVRFDDDKPSYRR